MAGPIIEQGILRGGRYGVLVRTPFDEAFVEKLKSMLPAPDRIWNGEAWWCAAEQLETVQFLVLQHWPGFMLIGEGGEDDQVVTRNGSTAQPRFL